jgi:hypothetical protein
MAAGPLMSLSPRRVYWEYVADLKDYKMGFLQLMNDMRLDAVLCPGLGERAGSGRDSLDVTPDHHLGNSGVISYHRDLTGGPRDVIMAIMTSHCRYLGVCLSGSVHALCSNGLNPFLARPFWQACRHCRTA